MATLTATSKYVGTVYLLHFDRPYKHARHYIGWAKDLEERLAQHLSGHGARLLEVAKAAGITWTLARTWTGTRNRERQIKRQGGASRCCPLCGVHARPDAGEILSADMERAYRLRENTDQWWLAATDEERARLDAERASILAETAPVKPPFDIAQIMKGHAA